MIHDPDLLEKLSAFPAAPFSGAVYRATRVNADPTAPTTRGGRWAPPGECPVLYTSLAADGALAEIAYYWSQLTPLPSRPVALHRLAVTTGRTLRLIEADLGRLGVLPDSYATANNLLTQAIGAAVAFLGCDGLLSPSARYPAENLAIFPDNHALATTLEVEDTRTVDWQHWAREKGLLRHDAI